MGLFDGLFGKKKTASASHILVKSDRSRNIDANEFLTKLKSDINKSKDVPTAFSEAAAKYSTCPSAKQGRSF